MSGDLKLSPTEATEQEHARWWSEKVAIVTFEISRADIAWVMAGCIIAAVYFFGINWDDVFGLRP